MNGGYGAEKARSSIRVPGSLGTFVKIEGRWGEVTAIIGYTADVRYLDGEEPAPISENFDALKEGPGFKSSPLRYLKSGQGPTPEEIGRASGTSEDKMERRALGPYIRRRKDRVDSDIGERRVEVVD